MTSARSTRGLPCSAWRASVIRPSKARGARLHSWLACGRCAGPQAQALPSNIRVLGCLAPLPPATRPLPSCSMTTVLLDAGTAWACSAWEALARIDHICLQPPHLTTSSASRCWPMRCVCACAPVAAGGACAARDAEALRQHAFNGVIWPDLHAPAQRHTHPVLSLHPYAVGDVVEPGGPPHRDPLGRALPCPGRLCHPGSQGAALVHRRHGFNPLLWQRLNQLQLLVPQ